MGRFINGDEVEVVESPERVLFFNLYTYCLNDPINEVDETGSLLASKVAQVILGAVSGMLIQLVSDLIDYLIQWVFHNRKNVFSPAMWNYIEAAIDGALDSVNPFKKKTKVLGAILKLVPSMINSVWDWISGDDFSLSDLIWEITQALVSAIIDASLSYSKKNDLKKLKKYYKKRSPEYKLKHLRLNAKFKVLGKRFDIGIEIASWIIDRVLKGTGVFA